MSTTEPEPLPIHRMARRMWIPSLVMGAMLVAIGFVISLVQAGRDRSAGVELELILSGITLALATMAKALGFQFDRITGLRGGDPRRSLPTGEGPRSWSEI